MLVEVKARVEHGRYTAFVTERLAVAWLSHGPFGACVSKVCPARMTLHDPEAAVSCDFTSIGAVPSLRPDRQVS